MKTLLLIAAVLLIEGGGFLLVGWIYRRKYRREHPYIGWPPRKE